MQSNTQLKSDKLAVLIDADNVTASVMKLYLKRLLSMVLLMLSEFTEIGQVPT